MTKFTVMHTVNEEEIKFLIDGEEIMSANHDEDGWNGMSRIEEMFVSVAKRLNIEVEYDHEADEG